MTSPSPQMLDDEAWATALMNYASCMATPETLDHALALYKQLEDDHAARIAHAEALEKRVAEAERLLGWVEKSASADDAINGRESRYYNVAHADIKAIRAFLAATGGGE